MLLPLIAPGLVTTGLLAFIAAWNEYLYALSFIQSPDNYTVPVAITSFVGQDGQRLPGPVGEIMAATVIVTLPLIVADADPAEADPRRPDRRRGQGLDGFAAGLRVEEVEPARVDGELDRRCRSAIRVLRADAGDEPVDAASSSLAEPDVRVLAGVRRRGARDDAGRAPC